MPDVEAAFDARRRRSGDAKSRRISGDATASVTRCGDAPQRVTRLVIAFASAPLLVGGWEIHGWHRHCWGARRHFTHRGTLMNRQSGLVCLSHLRWGFVYQRPNHLMSRCALERRVLFFEEPIYGEG